MVRGKASRLQLLIAMTFVLLIPTIMIPASFDSNGSEEEVVVMFNDYWMAQEIPESGIVCEPLDIHWHAYHVDGDPLIMDLYYRSMDMYDWNILAAGLNNTGTWMWDMTNPALPNMDGVQFLLIGSTSFGQFSTCESDFRIDIRNPNTPEVVIKTPLHDLEVSGELELTWRVDDCDTPSHLISIEIFLTIGSYDNYTLIHTNVESTGRYLIDTTEFSNSMFCKFLIVATDDTERVGRTYSPVFSIFNNNPPKLRLIHPREGDSVMGEVEVIWECSDPDTIPEKLLVDILYKPIGEESWMILLDQYPNEGRYLLNTFVLPQMENGFLLKIEVFDRQGSSSGIEVVKLWKCNPGENLIFDIEGPVSTVRDVIDLKWKVNEASWTITDDLVFIVWHKKNGEQYEELFRDNLLQDNFSYRVTIDDDGSHFFKLEIIDASGNGFSDMKEIGPIEVYHEQDPMVFVRSTPDEARNMIGVQYFNLTGYDRNGDIVRFLGYYRVVGGEWRIFDGSIGESNVVLAWNTTGIEPGKYEVRMVAYDSSIYNLTTTIERGPYFVESSGSTGYYHFTEESNSEDENKLSFGMITLISISIVLLLLGGIFLLFRKKMNEIEKEIREVSIAKGIVQQHEGVINSFNSSVGCLPEYGASSANEMSINGGHGSDSWRIDPDRIADPIISMAEASDKVEITDEDLHSYEVLGITIEASDQMIKNAYINYVKKFHPDHFSTNNPSLNMIVQDNIRKKNRAKAVLLDHSLRALLDSRLREDEGLIIRTSSTKTVEQLRQLM